MTKSKESKDNKKLKAQLKAQAKHKARVEEFKAAQRYLGLRPSQPGGKCLQSRLLLYLSLLQVTDPSSL
jgi:hypothetical protein